MIVGIFERPYDYFDDPIKLFLNLYLAKFLNISTKSSFPYNTHLFLYLFLHIAHTWHIAYLLN